MSRVLEEVSKRCPGGKLPETYLVMDTETSGIDLYKDRAIQYGFCFVHKGKVTNTFAQIVNRAGLVIPIGAYKVHGIDNVKMASEGIDPKWFVQEVSKILTDWRSTGNMFVGHNIMAFDAPMFELESTIQGCPFKFEANEVVDTGMLVKAAQLGMYMDGRESLRDFYRRVAEVRAKGVYWSLDRHCYPKYDLERRTGISKDSSHDAGVDCVLSHAVLEALKEEWANG